MFGFRSIVAILAAATTFTSALPATPVSGASVAKRDAAPMGADVFVRAPDAVVVRQASPTTIPDALTKAHSGIDPIIAEIRSSFL